PKPRTTSGGPIKIGHVRKTAAPKIPASAIAQRLSWSQAMSVQNIATVKHSATTCARNEYCANDPRKYVCEVKSEIDARAAIGTLAISRGSTRLAMRTTNPALGAALAAITPWSA